jgi:hypothetical protein
MKIVTTIKQATLEIALSPEDEIEKIVIDTFRTAMSRGTLPTLLDSTNNFIISVDYKNGGKTCA